VKEAAPTQFFSVDSRRGILSKVSVPQKSERKRGAMTAKQVTMQVLEQLPDDCSLQEVRYRLYVCDKITRGLEEAERGETLTHEEFKRSLAEWRSQKRGE
jgi:predicted transcriptional regulator